MTTTPQDEAPEKPPVNVEVSAFSPDDAGGRWVDELRLPADGILESRGGGNLGTYEKLLTDWQVYSTFQQRRTAVISREYSVQPGADDRASTEAAQYLQDNLAALDFDRICKKSLMAVFMGYSPAELMLVPDGTRFWLSDILVRRAQRFRFGRDGSLRLVNRAHPQGLIMPPGKFWVFQAGADDDDDPYGRGLGYYLYWPVWLKRNGLRHWSTFLETLAKGKFLAKVPSGTKTDQVTEVRKALSQLVGGGSVTVSDNVAIEIIEAARDSGGDFLRFCGYLDGAIAKIILSQTMTTDNGSSKSQSETHADVKLEVIKTDADLQCESFNRGPARWLTAWNFPGATPPKVWRDCTPDEDDKARAERDKVIYEIGFEPTPERIEEQYGPGYVKRTQPAAAPGAVPPAAEFAEGDQVAAAQDVAATYGADEWRPLMGPMVEALDSLADDCETLEEFQARLGEVARENPDELAESLARVMFAGRVAGQVGAEIDGGTS